MSIKIKNIDDLLGLKQVLNHAGGLKLEGADLRNADLSVKAFKEKHGYPENLMIPGVNLVLANLNYADLRGADLTGARLGGADLTDARLGGAILIGADLTGAILGGANLTGADLTGARLGDADLTGADLTGTILIDVYDLSTAINANTTNAILTYEDLLARDSKEQIMGGKNRKIRNKTRKTYKKRKNKKSKMLNKKRRLKTRKMK